MCSLLLNGLPDPLTETTSNKTCKQPRDLYLIVLTEHALANPVSREIRNKTNNAK